jgi:DNA-binding XRE family transcriptional regulator
MTRTALKHQLAAGLRVLREQAGVTREDAAVVIRASVPTVGHIETGRSLPSGLQLEKLLAHYGATDRIPTYLELRERARAGQDWWTALRGPIPAHRALFLGSESVAERIETWDPMQVPDLAQTPDYARALVRATEPTCPDDELDRRVELLVARQRAVLDENTPTVSLLIGEAALRWPVGSPAVIKAQVEHLMSLHARPETEVRLLPLDAERRSATSESFTILTFPSLSSGEEHSAVYTETLVSGYYYEAPRDVVRYRDALAGLRDAAVAPQSTHVFVRRINRF